MKRIFNLLKTEKISYVVLLFVIMCCIFNIFIFSYEMDSADVYDFLEDIVWAKATIDSGSLISKTFYYPYLIPFGSNIVMSIFVSIFGPSLIANQFGMLTYLILYLLVIFHLANSLFTRKEKVNYFVAISSLFVFTYAGENIFHHILYYGIALICFLGELGSVINILNRKDNVKNYIILGICCFFGSANSTSAAVLSNLVIIIGILVFSIFLFSKKEFNKYKNTNIELFIFVILITLFGIITYKIIEYSSQSMMLQEDRLLFGDSERVTRNLIQFTVRDFLNLFYLNNMVSMNAVGIIYYMGKLSFMLFILIIPIIEIRDLIKNTSKYSNDLVFSLICYIIVFAISFAFHTFSVTSNQRYLFLAIISLFNICAIYINVNLNKETFIAIVNMLLVVYLCFYSVVLVRLFVIGENKKSYYYEVVDVLNESDVKAGFAQIEYSVPLYVLSNSNIDSIYISNGKILYFNFDSNKLNRPSNGNSFFVLIPTEDIKNYAIDTFEKLCNKKINNDDYVLYIFDMRYWNKIYSFVK